RVPGMAAGSIPTGLQMAALTAAQYAAAQQAAAEQATQGYDFNEQGAGEQDRGFFDPSSLEPPRYESFDAAVADPLDFMPGEPNRAQLDLSALDLSSSGRRAATEEMLEGFASPPA